MLYHLLYEWLFNVFPDASVLNVFRYITFRTAYASITALVLALILGPWLIRRLRQFQVEQHIREEGPSHHQVKAGTPTMGGVLIVASTVLPTFLWTDLSNPLVWLGLGSMIGFGAIGFADDIIKIKRRRNLGLTARVKLGLQLLLSGAIAAGLLLLKSRGAYQTDLAVPFFKDLQPNLVLETFAGSALHFLDFLPFLLFVLVVLVGSSNAVNLTDGLDGLAIGPVMTAAATYALIVYLAGHVKFAEYLQIPHVSRVGELTVFCAAVVAAGLGFLWFNTYPAQMFMGDVGSLGLGAALGILAVISKNEILLVVVGGVFVVEAVSVIVQVASFKLRGKRVFRMAPIHHHYELKGWPEPQIIVRFWIVSIICALFALSTLKLR